MISTDAHLVEKLKKVLLRLYPNQGRKMVSSRSSLSSEDVMSPTVVYGYIHLYSEDAGEEQRKHEADDPILTQSLTEFIKSLKMSLSRELLMNKEDTMSKKFGHDDSSSPTVSILNSDFDLNLSAADIADLNKMMSDSIESDMVIKNTLIVLAYILIALAAIIGNILVVQLVIKSRRLHTLTHVLLANLAVADLLVATINIPFSAARVILQEWPFGSWLCHFVPFLQVASVYAISYTMTVIALDRYQVIMNPLGRRMKSCEGIPIVIGIWLLSFLLSLPYFLHHQVVNVLTLGVVRRCQAEFNSVQSRQLLTVATFLLQYLIPLFFTTLSYVAIMRRLQNSTVLGSTTPRQAEAQSRAKIKTIKMLVLTVICFGLSWAPINIYHLVTHFGLIRPNSSTILICHMIAMASCCYNPYIYCWLNEHFRMEAIRVSRCFRTPPSPLIHPGVEVNGMSRRRILQRHNQSLSPVCTTSFRTQIPQTNFQGSSTSHGFRPELIFVTMTSTSRSPSPPSLDHVEASSSIGIPRVSETLEVPSGRPVAIMTRRVSTSPSSVLPVGDNESSDDTM